MTESTDLPFGGTIPLGPIKTACKESGLLCAFFLTALILNGSICGLFQSDGCSHNYAGWADNRDLRYPDLPGGEEQVEFGSESVKELPNHMGLWPC